MTEHKKSWLIRIKNKAIMDARDLLLTDSSIESLRSLINPEQPDSVTARQHDEYIYSCGLQLVAEQIKLTRIKQRQTGLKELKHEDAHTITKNVLIEHLRKDGYDRIADEIENSDLTRIN